MGKKKDVHRNWEMDRKECKPFSQTSGGAGDRPFFIDNRMSCRPSAQRLVGLCKEKEPFFLVLEYYDVLASYY